MIEKQRLRCEDFRNMPVGSTTVWKLSDGAAIISARSLIIYLQHRGEIKVTSKADYFNNTLEVTRLK